MTLAACNGDPKAPNQGNESGTIEDQQTPEDLKLKSALVGIWKTSKEYEYGVYYFDFKEDGTVNYKVDQETEESSKYLIIEGAVFIDNTKSSSTNSIEWPYSIDSKNKLYLNNYTTGYWESDNNKGLIGTWTSSTFAQKFIFNSNNTAMLINYSGTNEPHDYYYMTFDQTKLSENSGTFKLTKNSSYTYLFTLMKENATKPETSFDLSGQNDPFTKEKSSYTT